MDKQELAIHRGEEAERLLNSEMLNQAFDDVRQAFLNTWATLDTVNDRYTEFAHDLHRKVKCLDAVKRCIQEHVNNGKISQKTIEARLSRASSFSGLKNALKL